MRAIGKYIAIKPIRETNTKTKGGLILAESQREDVRYRQAKVVVVGESVKGLKPDDKIYYDTSLTKAVTKSPTITSNFLFNYLGMNFTSYDSIFYFKDNIDLVGKMWSNLYDF